MESGTSVPEAPHEALQRLIAEQGRQKRWVAEEVGITAYHLSRLLQGRQRITRQMAVALGAVLDVPPETFLEGEQ